MDSEPSNQESDRTIPNLVGQRIRSRREELGLPQEKLGVAIGLEESSSRARICRYELGNHEPQLGTARNIAKALGVPLAYLYCEESDVAELLLAMQGVEGKRRASLIFSWLEQVAQCLHTCRRGPTPQFGD